jgi:hypothetical protein
MRPSPIRLNVLKIDLTGESQISCMCMGVAGIQRLALILPVKE